MGNDNPCGKKFSPSSKQSINFRTDASGVNWTGGTVIAINANPTTKPPPSSPPGTPPGTGESPGSSGSPSSPGDPPAPSPEGITGYPLTILGSSGNDGNIESNVLDGNVSTRWSDNGIGSWIAVDMGETKLVNEVDINWYKGDQRSNNFIISSSLDNVKWINSYSGSSSQGAEAQRYTMTQFQARYIKVTVNGNTQNDWASINSLYVNGPGATGTSPPPPPPDAMYNEFDTIFNEDFYDIGLCQPV